MPAPEAPPRQGYQFTYPDGPDGDECVRLKDAIAAKAQQGCEIPVSLMKRHLQEVLAQMKPATTAR